MMLGNNIEILISPDFDAGKVIVRYDGRMVGGIQSVNLDVSAGAFGENFEKFTVEMWDPKEMYYSDEQLHIQQDFIDAARKAGAEVKLRSVLDFSDSNISEDEPESVGAGAELAQLATACAAIVGIAAIFGSSNKKRKVQNTRSTPIMKDKQRPVSIKR